MDKILAVSFIAMLAVSAANAKVVTQTNIVGGNGISVSVPVSGDNAGKVEVTNSIAPASGTSNTAAGTAIKEVSIPSITDLQPGQIIVVTPSVTTTVGGENIKLNNGTAYPILRNGAATTTTTGPYVWTTDRPAVFVFDGSHWVFIGGYDLNTNTTYSAMSVSEGRTGTVTSSRTMRADYLKQIVQGTDASGENGLAQGAKLGDGYAKASSASDVTKSDTIREAIGKLEKKADDAATAASAAADAQVNADWNATSGKAQILNKPTLATVATSGSYNDLSNKPTIPTVNNATLTIQQNGTTVKTFTANASSNVTANITVPTQASDIGAAAASHNHASQDVNAMTGYTKPSSTSAIAATDTLNAAIGKLEKALDGKQATMTVDTAMSSTSTNPVQNKVVNTELGKKVNTAQGSSAANKAVITNSSGNITTGQITSGMIANSAVTSAAINNGAIINDDISGSAAITTNKMGAITGYEKASTNADLAATDTLNTALGKLEKKADDAAAAASAAADAQVNADWNATSGKAQILNKPTLATVATSGSYNDLSNKPTIPTVNNATLTIQQNGTTVKTFTANASSNVTANITVPTQASDIGAAAASHTHASQDVNAMTGYTKPSSTSAIAATDTLNAAIGKLEKALDGKQATMTVDTAMSSTSTNPVQNKVVNTELGKKVNTAQGSGAANKAVITNSSGNITTGTITSAMITDGTIANADIASNAAIAVSKISGAQTTANMVTSTSDYNDDIANANKYPNMPVVNQMIGDSQVALTSRVGALESGKIDKTVAADANAVMVRGTGGTYVKGTGTDITVAGSGAITVNHATSANSIPSGSENATTYATIWVE